MQGTAPGRAGGGRRVGWVDAAKGLGAVLIVLGHAAAFSGVAGIRGPWVPVVNDFASFPLPLFFFAAGVVGAPCLAEGAAAVLRRRVVPLLWVYLLWAAISTCTLGLLHDPHPLRRLPTLLITLDPNMWFVCALALFFVVARAVRRLPGWLQLLAAAGIAAAFGTGGPWCPPGDATLGKTALGLLAFLLGVRLAGRVRDGASGLRARHALAATGAYVAVALLTTTTPLGRIPGMNVVLLLLAVPAGVALAAVLSRSRTGPALRRIGRHSLPIYLLQFFPTALLPRLLAPVLSTPSAGLWFPPLLAAAALVLSLVAYRATQRIPGLYEPPAAVNRWVVRATRRWAGAAEASVVGPAAEAPAMDGLPTAARPAA